MSLSARSSSGSWSRAGGAPPDIIDLDKFMRGAVRPPRPEPALRCDQLVVDAGGFGRKQPPPPPAAPLPAPSRASSSSGSRPPPHAKRFSHDSGLSDGSYARRKTRAARRGAGEARRGAAEARPPPDNASLRAFRAVCERALLDQQAQIARVAALCERLSERPPRPPRAHPPSPDTSDVSSSSRSTRDQRRKDKHRTEECKTYKIIMNKLDELNRLFAARARSPAAPPAPRAPPPRRAAPSSVSVSVSDKVVATEPERAALAARAGSGSARLSALRAVTHACALDIPPRDPPLRYNVATESVLQADSRVPSSAGDPRCGFDLDDPVHLYSQAKRLQALPAATRRARSVETAERRGRRAGGERARARAGGGARLAEFWHEFFGRPPADTMENAFEVIDDSSPCGWPKVQMLCTSL
ncbi:uncharacterized protein LOC126055292 [Helicoverpa armigera]|uniref:uncharacterized protein LOC126055292 n=1 Tax=Helicoverpa armigera TaxID=29058 RepID=UPI003083829A